MNGHNEKTERSNMQEVNPTRDMPLPTLEVAKHPNGVRSESHRESYNESYNETQIARRKRLYIFGLVYYADLDFSTCRI